MAFICFAVDEQILEIALAELPEQGRGMCCHIHAIGQLCLEVTHYPTVKTLCQFIETGHFALQLGKPDGTQCSAAQLQSGFDNIIIA